MLLKSQKKDALLFFDVCTYLPYCARWLPLKDDPGEGAWAEFGGAPKKPSLLLAYHPRIIRGPSVVGGRETHDDRRALRSRGPRFPHARSATAGLPPPADQKSTKRAGRRRQATVTPEK
ncbi:MAG: hypothetical protein BJ554DRAFT_903 [Olpidium bornovanus]|uniref:Uncharacterized protein n=1 Tax=Olpidium bornovanus TaxID=278681 RepID=A0A8H7ZSJ5_9FUNG|nr:MAG: hypothetical protein BJ554DRAFT_903 [Olpidium bornovanus]